jgi:hypothetical protein
LDQKLHPSFLLLLHCPANLKDYALRAGQCEEEDIPKFKGQAHNKRKEKEGMACPYIWG